MNRINRVNLTKNAQAALGRPAVVASGQKVVVDGQKFEQDFKPVEVEQKLSSFFETKTFDYASSVQPVPISLAAQLDFKELIITLEHVLSIQFMISKKKAIENCDNYN